MKLNPNQSFAAASAEEPLLKTARDYPELRYMGSKHRLLPWIFEVLSDLDFETVMDPFSGSGCVAYLFKCMGKRVSASDFLAFPAIIAKATVENSDVVIDGPILERLLYKRKRTPDFIQKTFRNIFYSAEDLAFLDQISANIAALQNPYKKSLALSALVRSCVKKQPRGVFTVSGVRHDDGRRATRLSIQEHFLEQVQIFNATVFDNGNKNTAVQRDIAEVVPTDIDLVYLDPPYVPRAGDNDYIKRYHFLEGLVSYWKGLEIMENSKVKKIRKRFTPFSYRRTAENAFDDIFRRFNKSQIVLSHSSNGYPDLAPVVKKLKQYKHRVTVHQRAHRYHFGTHCKVLRSKVQEYLLVGS